MKTILVIVMLFAAALSTSLPEGEYKISCKVAQNNVLDIEKAVNDNGANLIVYGWHTGNNQRFYLNYVEGEWATLVAKHSNKALTVTGNTEGAVYQQYDNIESPQQLFKIQLTSDKYYLIKNKATGLVLNCNADAKSEINNRLAVQEGRDCSDAQKLTFTRLDVPN